MTELQTLLSDFSKLLKPMHDTPAEQSKSLSVMQAPGSTNLALKTITPRQQTISTERARQAYQFLRHIKSHRKVKPLWDEKTESWKARFEYNIPDYNDAQIKAGIIELLKPCSPGITAHFVKLQVARPIYNADEMGLKMRWEGLYEDVKDYSEVAVVLTLEDMRKAPGKGFPTNHEILEAVSEYHTMIADLQDYLGE